MSETRVSEPKAEGAQKVRKVKRNRKDYGEIRYYPGKITVYWAKRRTDQYHRVIGGWLVDADTVSAIKLYGVTHVGLKIEDGTQLLTSIATFGTLGLERGAQRMRSNTYVDEWGNRGAICWHIPAALWAHKEPPEEVKHAFMMEAMHLKRGRSKSKVT
jgi:hypothetical protein